MIAEPNLPEQKPVKYLVHIICYLACQPFSPDTTPLIELYVKLAHWHRAAKHYIRDFTPDFISPDFKLMKANKIEPHELMSANI